MLHECPLLVVSLQWAELERPKPLITYGAFPLHGTARYGSLLGGFPLGTVPGTFLVPPWPGFQAIRTVTKT